MAAKKFSYAWSSNTISTLDNGGCGDSTFIGEGGNARHGIKNFGYHQAYSYPFILMYHKKDDLVKTDPLNNEDWVSGRSKDSFVSGDGNIIGHVATNMFSRMSQKQALHHAQGAFWMCIVVVQWADLLICKTRWLSIVEQGMANDVMNFGLFFETLLAAWLAYFPVFELAFGTRNIKVTHWFPAMPFSMLIFGYDETRKYLMRCTSPVKIDKLTGQSKRTPGWLERNTYY